MNAHCKSHWLRYLFLFSFVIISWKPDTNYKTNNVNELVVGFKSLDLKRASPNIPSHHAVTKMIKVL